MNAPRALLRAACLLAACLALAPAPAPVDLAQAARDGWTEVPVSRAGRLEAAKSFTLFRLTADIAAPSSGLEIVPAPGVTDIAVDLAGHTLRFGDAPRDLPEGRTMMSYMGLLPTPKAPGRNIGQFGIFHAKDPRLAPDGERFAPGQWGSGTKRIAIYSSLPGGRIVQGAGGGAVGAGILLEGVEQVWIGGVGEPGQRNLTIEVHGPDFFGVNTAGCAEVRVRDVAIVHRGRHVTNRHAVVAALSLGPGRPAPDGGRGGWSEAANVDIAGSPQAGIVVRSRCRVLGCRISQDVVVTNGYGVQGWKAQDVEVAGNLIAPACGRGIHLSEGSSGWDVRDNVVRAREKPVQEYPSGYLTHGIKLEKTANSRVHGNLVVAWTGPGTSAHALDTDLDRDSGNVVRGNVFAAVNTGHADPARAVAALLRGDGTGSVFSGNRLLSNQVLVAPAAEPVRAFTLEGNVLGRLAAPPSPAGFETVRFVPWKHPRTGIRLVDNRFEGGADFRDVWIKDLDLVRDEYTAAFTLEVRAQDASGAPLPGARVEAALPGAPRQEAVTDDQGLARLVLEAGTWVLGGDQALPLVQRGRLVPFPGTVHPPYAVSVEHGGRSARAALEMDRPRALLARFAPAATLSEQAPPPPDAPPAPDPKLLEP